MMKKKIIAIGLAVLMLLTVLSACSGGISLQSEARPCFQ